MLLEAPVPQGPGGAVGLMAPLSSMVALGMPRDGQGGSAHTEAIGIHSYPWLCIFHCSWEQGEVISG